MSQKEGEEKETNKGKQTEKRKEFSHNDKGKMRRVRKIAAEGDRQTKRSSRREIQREGNVFLPNYCFPQRHIFPFVQLLSAVPCFPAA